MKKFIIINCIGICLTVFILASCTTPSMSSKKQYSESSDETETLPATDTTEKQDEQTVETNKEESQSIKTPLVKENNTQPKTDVPKENDSNTSNVTVVEPVKPEEPEVEEIVAYEPLDITPVNPTSSDFLVKTAASLIPSNIKKNEKKLASASTLEKDRAFLLYDNGKNYVMYANAFIQHNAQMLPYDRYDEQYAEFVRAKAFYLRGRDYVLDSLDYKYPGIRKGLKSSKEEKILEAVHMISKDDVETVYWCAAGWLGAFSLDPLDSKLLESAPAAVKLLEYTCELVPDYDNGSIWDILCAYYAAAPDYMGGGMDKALAAYDKILSISGGKTIGPYITYAQSICVKQEDSKAFKDTLKAALKVKKPSGTNAGVAYTISKQKAQWLLEHVEDYFVDWEE